jgi:ABC-type oligopeptide transport system ATPase subunit
MLTKEERLAIIKSAVESVQKRNEFRAKAKKGASKALVKAIPELQAKRAADKKFQEKMDAMNENYNHYTDSEKYAKQYYGDVYSDTTKFDNEWH